MKIYRYDLRNSARYRVATGETTAVQGAAADSDNPFWVRSSVESPLQRLLHISGNGTRHEQNVSVPWRSNESQAKLLDVIERVTQCMNFKLAPVAGTGIDLADGETAPQTLACHAAKISGELFEHRVTNGWGALGERRSNQTLKEQHSHYELPLDIMARVGAIERLVAQWKVGNDISFDGGFQKWPLKPGWVTNVTAGDRTAPRDAQPHQYVTAKSLDQRHAFACFANVRQGYPQRSDGQRIEDLLN
jgi:hypothetical protein